MPQSDRLGLNHERLGPSPSHHLIPVAQTSYVDYNYSGRTFRISPDFDYRQRWCYKCEVFETWHSELYIFVATKEQPGHYLAIAEQIDILWRRAVEEKHPSKMTAIELAERYRVLSCIKLLYFDESVPNGALAAFLDESHEDK